MRKFFVAAACASLALGGCGSEREVAAEREDAVVEGEAVEGSVIGEGEAEREGDVAESEAEREGARAE